MVRILIALLLFAPAALAQPGGDKVTPHTLAMPGGPLAFSAEVATMKLATPQGTPTAEIITTAFLRKDADPATRPITFLFNGGPGASSAWLELGAVGPWRVPFGGGAVVPSRSPLPVPNAQTWLDFTDLVFVDPPGTGYSRMLGKEPDKRVYSVNGDIDLLAAVVRRWLETHGRLLSPKFVAGESYGGFRGPLLARALLDKQGVGISGLVMISPVLDFNGRQAQWNLLHYVNELPSMAATYRHASSRTELADVEHYATGEFLADLFRGEADVAAVARLSQHVAALIGLDPALVARHLGRVPISMFLRERTPGVVYSPYDATLGTADPFPAAMFDNSADPLLDGMRAPITSAVLHLYEHELDWHPEGWPARQYEVLNNALAREWDYGSKMDRPEAYTALRQYLAVDPAAVAAVAHGLTDLVTPYFASALLLAQTPALGPSPRLALWTYAGGHMFYSRDASRSALHDDAARLVAAAVAARP